VWTDRAPDAAAVAAYLEEHGKPGTLKFEPVALPPGTDMAVLHQAALLRARTQLAQSHAEADRILAQEVRAIDDLVRTANLLVERLREWYALHAPEATRAVPDAEQLARLVADQGDRTAVMAALDMATAATTSLGTDLDPADLAVLQGFAGALKAVHESWRSLEARVTDLMATVAPNVASVVGPVLGARLIAISGGLTRLATWPSGTVQLLGAETALFRHLKEGTRPPKHGILFQHPSVHQAPPWSRGAVARALALAAATGAKADAFTKNDLRDFLAKQLAADMERIAKRKPAPRPRFDPRQKGGRPAFPQRGPSRGPPRDGPRSFPPRDGPRSYPPRDGPRAPPPRDAPRDFPPRAPPPRDGPGPGGPPRDGPDRRPWKKKPQGAFRSDNAPARPPGRGGG
jgi:nucleolar protein 56